jgi:DNA-binding response OmpR family regulator
MKTQEARRLLPGAPAPSPRDFVVLVVDDEDDLREFVAYTLTQAGHRVLKARHGAEAVELSIREKGPIDLLVTDLMMPFLDGASLSRLLETQRPGIQTLFMTGYPHDSLQKWGILDASTPRLRKPFHLGDLTRIVEDLLRG